MSKQLVKNKIIVLFILLFSILFISIYNYNKSYATIEFEQKNINVPGYARFCEIFFASNGEYIYNEEYILPKQYNTFHKIILKLKLNIKNIHHLRLDPLRSKGEVYLKNFNILQYDGFKEVKTSINFIQTTTQFGHNIKILDKNTTFLHLYATGFDPYINIGNNILIDPSLTNYYDIITSLTLSIIIILFLMLIYIGIVFKYFTLENTLVILILSLYTVFTLFFSAGDTPLAGILLKYFFICIFILFFIHGVGKYSYAIKNISFIILGLTLLVYISDIANQKEQIYTYIQLLPYMIFSLFFPIIFIHDFTKNDVTFYKRGFIILFLIMSIVIITIHQWHFAYIDHLKIFSYRMYMGQWAEKNYTFWYLFLMWGSISFLHFKKYYIHESLLIVFILIISAFVIFNGYSVSAKLAFIISLLIYILFTTLKIRIKLALLYLIPSIISLYVFFMPWISDIFIYLGELHPRLSSREPIIAISSALVKEHFLFGYGFRTTPSIPIQEYLPDVLLQKYGNPIHIPAMNPHNIPMLIWLNFGALGALLFSILIYKSLKTLIRMTIHKNNQAALLALIVSFLIITTFSWSGWWKITYLTYSFFVSIILLSLNTNKVFKNDNTKI